MKRFVLILCIVFSMSGCAWVKGMWDFLSDPTVTHVPDMSQYKQKTGDKPNAN